MTTPLFPSVIGHNVLDGGTDAQDGNSYPGPLLQEYAAAVVGAAGLVAKRVAPNAYYAKRTRRGIYGRKVSSWEVALASSAGTATRVLSTDQPPWSENATYVLRLDQNATASYGQCRLTDYAQNYMPRGTGTGPAATPTTGGFSAGVWVKNPTSRTLNFELRMYNSAANRSVAWNCAVEPGDWRFITLSPTQDTNGTWVRGTDSVSLVRVSQQDTQAEGAWAAGEYLLFGGVYVDCAARPRFLITFDDGYLSQRYPQISGKVSGTAYVASTLSDVLTTNATHTLIIGEPIVFGETAPTSLTVGTTYWVKTVPSSTTFTLATDATLATTATTTGFSGTAKYQYGGGQGLSGQQIVESYGFRGSLFIVGSWIGTTGTYAYSAGPNKFLSGSDIQAMWAEGWSIGSHSDTHPSNNDQAGLRLLGPYGYYLSNPYDNLPAQYLTNFSITASYRRRVTAGTQASPSVFTTENAHKFLVNQPIVFTDVAPTGCTLGTTYYVATTPTTTTFTLATDQGTLASKINNTTGAWSGTANYKWPGSALDDSAIYADIVAGAEKIKALGITTAYKFFALPQGAFDQYVRSACLRAGITWVRGISTATVQHTIPVGYPSGGGNGMPSGGWQMQPDCVQTDGTQLLSVLTGYVDETVTQGACGCLYHHDVTLTNLVSLDRMCSYLRTKVDAGSIDVLTCDELATELGF